MSASSFAQNNENISFSRTISTSLQEINHSHKTQNAHIMFSVNSSFQKTHSFTHIYHLQQHLGRFVVAAHFSWLQRQPPSHTPFSKLDRLIRKSSFVSNHLHGAASLCQDILIDYCCLRCCWRAWMYLCMHVYSCKWVNDFVVMIEVKKLYQRADLLWSRVLVRGCESRLISAGALD